MKGITHFMSGVAISTFFGGAVEMAAMEKSFIMVLGGMFGILADTLDFKFYSFFTKQDHEIDPDHLNPDANKIAEQIGAAIEQAYDENRLVKVKCQTIRMGADLWRQYVIKFDPEHGQVVVVINPIVTTSKIPYLGTEPEDNRVGKYKLRVPMVETHGRPTVVDIMNGPEIGFRRDGDAVRVEFIPFHRTWTHSFFTGFVAAAIVAVIASFAAGWNIGWYYGLVALAGYWAHLIEDATGYMGAAFLWPFKKKRTRGLKWFKAQDPHSNFIFNYSCLMVSIYNLNRFTFINNNPALGNYIQASFLKYFFYTLVIPIGIYLLLIKIFGEKKPKEKEAVIMANEALGDIETAQGEIA